MPIDQPSKLSCELCGGAHPTSEHNVKNEEEVTKSQLAQKIIVNFADTPSRQKMYHMRPSESEVLDYAEGWKTLGETTKLFRPGEKSLEMLIAPLRLSHPEWFVVRKTARGAEAEHFHPNLITLVEKKINEKPPENWRPASNFGKNITQIASITARAHPELTRPYTALDGPNRGQFILYYSPEFFNAMEQWLNELQQKTFPIETTPEDLESTFGVLRYTAPRTSSGARTTPYATLEEISSARDAVIEKIREELIEDQGRQRRARKAYGKIKEDIIRSRLQDEEDSENDPFL